jgi:hypothetical protein
MGVGPVTVQATGPAVDILPVIMFIVHSATRIARELNLPLPIKGRQLPVHRQTGPTTFTPTGTAMSTAGQIRGGRSVPTRAGKQIEAKQLRPSSNSLESARDRCKGTDPSKPSNKEPGRSKPGSSKPGSLTAAIRHVNGVIKGPAVIVMPAAVEAAAEVVEVAVVEVEVVEVEVVAANSF